MNNQGLRKRLLGEVDVFQFDHTHELYAHMNINYIKLDRLPAFDRWGDALAPLAKGEFFTTTGEVLLPDVDLAASSAAEIVAKVRAQWTFPLRFAEIVWGDGQTTHREVIELAETREFGSKPVRVASQGERLEMGPRRGLGRRRQRRVREPVLAAIMTRRHPI